MLAIIHALTKWRQYLLGSKLSTRTDYNSLQFLLQQKSLSTKQQKWMEKLLAFDLEILHKKGKENVIADALSRKDDDNTTCVALVIVPDWLDEMQVEYAKYLDYGAMIENISEYANFDVGISKSNC